MASFDSRRGARVGEMGYSGGVGGVMVVVVVGGISCGSSVMVVWSLWCRGEWLCVIPGSVPESVKWSIGG